MALASTVVLMNNALGEGTGAVSMEVLDTVSVALCGANELPALLSLVVLAATEVAIPDETDVPIGLLETTSLDMLEKLLSEVLAVAELPGVFELVVIESVELGVLDTTSIPGELLAIVWLALLETALSVVWGAVSLEALNTEGLLTPLVILGVLPLVVLDGTSLVALLKPARLGELEGASVAVLDPKLAEEVLDTKELPGVTAASAECVEVLEASTGLPEVLVANEPVGLLSLGVFNNALLELSEATALEDAIALAAVDAIRLVEPTSLAVLDNASLDVTVPALLEVSDTMATLGIIVASGETLEDAAEFTETVELPEVAEAFAGSVEVLDAS